MEKNIELNALFQEYGELMLKAEAMQMRMQQIKQRVVEIHQNGQKSKEPEQKK